MFDIRKADRYVLALSALLAAGMTWLLSLWVPRELWEWAYVDIWFNADVPRAVSDLTAPTSSFMVFLKHPLFALLLWPVSSFIDFFLDSRFYSIRVLMGLNAAACVFLLGFHLRKAGLSLVDQILCVSFFLASAAFLFWQGVPETYPFGATTMLVGFCAIYLIAIGDRMLRIAAIAGVIVLSLSMTTTNVTAGLAATCAALGLVDRLNPTSIIAAVRARFRDLAIYFGAAGALALVLILAQWLLFERGGVNVMAISMDLAWHVSGDGLLSLRHLMTLVFGPIVFPTEMVLAETNIWRGERLTNQYVSVGPFAIQSVPHLTALLSLAVVFALASLGTFRILARRVDVGEIWYRLAIANLGVLGFYLIFHLFYFSEEVFLFAGHFAPLMALFAANAFASGYAVAARVAIVLVVFAGGWHNLEMLSRTIEMTRQLI